MLLYRNMRGPKGIGTSPQFTRQNLRQRRDADREADTTPGVAGDVPAGESVADGEAGSGADSPEGSTGVEPVEGGPDPQQEGDRPRSAADGGHEGSDGS